LREFKTENATTTASTTPLEEGEEGESIREKEADVITHVPVSPVVIDYCAVRCLCSAIPLEFQDKYSDLENECLGYQIVELRNKSQGISKVVRDSVVREFQRRVCECLLPSADKRKREYWAKKRTLKDVSQLEVTPTKKKKNCTIKQHYEPQYKKKGWA
jgi:hypothetical protein